MDFQNLSIEEIRAYAAERRAFAEQVAADDGATLAQVQEAEAALAEEEAALAAAAEAEGNEPASAEAVASLRSRVTASVEDEVEAAEEETEEAAEEAEVEAEVVEVEASEPAPVQAQTQARPPVRSRIAAVAAKAERPKAPALNQPGRVTITAAAEVPNFAGGEELSGLGHASEALMERLAAFPTPQGTMEQDDPRYKPDFRFAGVAKINLNIGEEFQIRKGKDHLAVLAHAGDEKRLKSEQGEGSLVAAGGWCTPSENLYDLCEGETLDGLLSAPEVSVDRGGINFTKGPDFATLFADADFGWFKQTEAQAEAGTTKPCFELTCPDWNDVRLDAVGLCLRVPILTNAAFPELTARITRGALVAHQHKRNADIISRIVTIAGAATAAIDYGTTAHSLFAHLALVANIKRQQYKLGLEESMEVVLPYWVKDAIREDLALRGGRPIDAITDAYIMAEFSVRKLNPQFVYDWQELDSDTITAGYPSTVDVLVYPAGTITVGTSDVINLSAVYDAASLAENVFTGLFFEQGLLVANTCFDVDRITVPLCGAGRTGAQSITVCGVDTTP